MTVIDGSASATLGGLRSTGFGVVGDQVTVPFAPADRTRYPLLSLHLQAILSTTGSTNSDIQWQVSADAGFVDVVWSLTALMVSSRHRRAPSPRTCRIFGGLGRRRRGRRGGARGLSCGR